MTATRLHPCLSPSGAALSRPRSVLFSECGGVRLHVAPVVETSPRLAQRPVAGDAHSLWRTIAARVDTGILGRVFMALRAVCLEQVIQTHRCAALRDAVLHVICVRAEEEVLRVDAWRDVACVADKYPLGDRSTVHFPRESVCVDLTAALPASPYGAIAASQYCRPQPARRSKHGMDWPVLIDLRPESFCESFSHGEPATVRGFDGALQTRSQACLPSRSAQSRRFATRPTSVRGERNCVGSWQAFALPVDSVSRAHRKYSAGGVLWQ